MNLVNIKRLSVIFFTAIATSATEDTAKDTILVIEDGGQYMRLGGLYDARTDEVIPGQLWNMNADFINKHKEVSPATHTRFAFSRDDTIGSRLKLLDIDVAAQFQMMRPLFTLTLGGSFEYLKDRKSASKSVHYALCYKTRTTRKSLDVFNGEMLANVNKNVMDNDHATHFVSSITYGADTVVSFDTSYNSEEEKQKISIEITGNLKFIAFPPLTFDSKGSFKDESFSEKIDQNTRIRVYGDLKLDNIPINKADALEFIRNIPSLTKTSLQQNTNGVPKEITLTPLSWMNSKAARLTRRLEKDFMEQLLEIHNKLEESESRISDVHVLRYDGFSAWKRSLDLYLSKFQSYRSRLTLDIKNAIASYYSDNGSITNINKIQTKYYENNNIYSLHSIIQECEKRKLGIASLLALASQFVSTGVTFAENLSDFYAPTFDSRFDRVYALILVGMNPSDNRKSISLIRDFVKLAASHKVKNGQLSDPEIIHCKKKHLQGEYYDRCIEHEAFVVIHFDSFCEELCTQKLCSIPKSSDSCSIDNSVSPCDNNNNPLNDCWCTCPKTQILQFVENGDPERLVEETLPRVPKKPKIKVLGYLDHELERIEDQQMITVDVSGIDESTRYWKVILDYTMTKIIDGDVYFTNHQKKVYTKSNSTKITVDNLVIGRKYAVTVTGVNSVGEGRPSNKQDIKIGHINLHNSD